MVKNIGPDMKTQAPKAVFSDLDKGYFLWRFQLPTAPRKTVVQKELRLLYVRKPGTAQNAFTWLPISDEKFEILSSHIQR